MFFSDPSEDLSAGDIFFPTGPIRFQEFYKFLRFPRIDHGIEGGSVDPVSVVSDESVASDAQFDIGLCVPGVHFRWAPDIVVGAALDFLGCIVLEPVVLLKLVGSSAKVATWQVGGLHLTLSCLNIYLSGIGGSKRRDTKPMCVVG